MPRKSRVRLVVPLQQLKAENILPEDTMDEEFVEYTPKSKKAKKEKIKKEEFVDLDEPSEFELLVQRNIAERRALMEELNIKQSKFRVDETSPKSKKAPSRRGLSAPSKEKQEKNSEPSRRSLRLQKIDADTGLQLPEKEPTRYSQYEDDTPARPALENLVLEDICDDVDEAKTYLSEKVKPYINVDDKKSVKSGQKSIFSGDVSSLGLGLKKLKITSERVAKVVPTRIFSLAVHPTESKVLVAAGGKWGAIGFWDVNDIDDEKRHGVHLFRYHARPINCLTYDNFDSTKLISTSYDGTVRLFDLEQQKSKLLFGLADDDPGYTTYHSQIDAHTFLVTMGKSGQIGHVDARVSNLKTVADLKVYDKVSPKMVNVHPVNTNLFVTPSNKGDCCIFDLRSAGSSKKQMKPLVSMLGHTKALSSAFFNRVTGNKVVTAAYDNKIRLYDTTEIGTGGRDIKPYKSISHNNQTGRWLTTFKAEWHPKHDDVLFVGSMVQPRQIDVFSGQGDHFALKGEDLASVCSIVKCHPSQDIIVGGNSSGRVHVFM